MPITRNRKKKLQPIETRRAVACAVDGHPPIVEVFFGQVTCARCGAILGDTLLGSFDLKSDVIVEHDCKTCRKNARKLTKKDQRLLPLPARAYLKQLLAPKRKRTKR